MAKPIKIEIVGDDKSFRKAMDGVGSKLGSITKKVAAFGAVAGGAAAAGVAKLGIDAIGLASDLGEAQGAAETIFGDGFNNLEKSLQDSATAMGLNRVEALNLSNNYGVLFKDLTDAERATATLDATARAADVGSMFNEDPAAVAEAFTSAINGSSETVRRFGIDTSDAALKQYALENGIGAANGALTESEKKMIRHQIIMRDSEIAAGNFAETSGGLANQQRILGAQFDELKIKAGEKLLPVAVKVAQFFTEKLVPAVERIGGEIGEKLSPLIDELVPRFRQLASQVADNMQPTIEALTDYWNQALKPALAAILPVLGQIAELIITKVVPFILSRLLPALIRIQTTMARTVLPVLRVFTRVLGTVLGAANDMKFGLVEAWDEIAASFQGVYDSIIRILDDIVAAVRGLPGRVSGAISDLGGSLRSSVTGLIPGFAAGTSYAPGGVVDVGERGRERIILPRGSQVIPAHRVDSAGGGLTVNVYSQWEGGEIGRRVGEEAAWYARTAGI